MRAPRDEAPQLLGMVAGVSRCRPDGRLAFKGTSRSALHYAPAVAELGRSHSPSGVLGLLQSSFYLFLRVPRPGHVDTMQQFWASVERDEVCALRVDPVDGDVSGAIAEQSPGGGRHAGTGGGIGFSGRGASMARRSVTSTERYATSSNIADCNNRIFGTEIEEISCKQENPDRPSRNLSARRR